MRASSESGAAPGTRSRPAPSRRRAPSARAMPEPPSLVALPPTPTTIRRGRPSSAAATNSPTPSVLARRGSRSARSIRASPFAIAASTVHVPVSAMSSTCAVRARPSASCVAATRIRPPVARASVARNPGPPSESGSSSTVQCDRAAARPRAIAAAASSAVRLSLNSWGATRTRMASEPIPHDVQHAQQQDRDHIAPRGPAEGVQRRNRPRPAEYHRRHDYHHCDHHQRQRQQSRQRVLPRLCAPIVARERRSRHPCSRVR